MTEFFSTSAGAGWIPLLAATLLHFLWQGAVIGLLAWAALLALRNARPQARYAVACLALLACVVAPAVTFAKLQSAGAAQPIPVAAAGWADVAGDAAASAGTPLLASLQSPLPSLLSWVVMAWAAGAFVFALRMGSGLWWVRGLRASPACADGGRWQVCADAFARGFGLRRRVLVRVIENGDSPLSVGWWKPMVLLPAAIVANLPAPLLEALVAHELAHVRRHDYLVSLLQGAVEALLFYHPVVWWLSRRIRIERELVADGLAARQLGDPRRLALALSELDRLHVVRSPVPHFAPAQAAHGGQLMFRIRQLLRPERRLVGSVVLVPVVGIVALGIAVQAYARLGNLPQPQGVQASTPAVPPVPPAAAPVPPLAPASPPRATAPAIPAAPVLAPPAAPPVPPAPTVAHFRGDRDGFALVHKNAGGLRLMGNSVDSEEIRRTTPGISGDFIWFRRGGKAYIVRDAGILARAEEAWAALKPQEARMQALESQMQPHREKLEVLGKRMGDMGTRLGNAPEARAAERAMQALAEQQRQLAESQRALAMKQMHADAGQRAVLDRRMQQLSVQQDALNRQMESHSAVMQAQQARFDKESARMDAMSREMDAARVPLDGIARQMDELGREIDRQARVSDQRMRALIDEAVRNGSAQPVPSRE